MKRLVKAYDEDKIIKDINTMETWVLGDTSSVLGEEIDEILDKNQDCIYSGVLYRMFVFYDKINEGNINDIDNLKSLININPSYQSFTKSYDWIMNEAENSDIFDKEDIVIIKHFGTGLDVNKFINKYKNHIIKNGYKFQEFDYQNEIISKLSNDFEIIYAGGHEFN